MQISPVHWVLASIYGETVARGAYFGASFRLTRGRVESLSPVPLD